MAEQPVPILRGVQPVVVDISAMVIILQVHQAELLQSVDVPS
jgi:hypothetical protein